MVGDMGDGMMANELDRDGVRSARGDGRGRVVGMVLAALVAASGFAVPALAQEDAPGPVPADRVRAVADALGALADHAELGAWQAADEAFNDTLDAIEAHRGPLEAELGDAARASFAEIAARLPDLDEALAAEDAPVIRALVDGLVQQLVTLSPAAGERTPVPELQAAGAILAWRDALSLIVRLSGEAAWRDMRNAAIDLLDDIARRGPAIARDGGPAVAVELDRLRVFALRLRAAALDQSPEEGARAAALFESGLDRLLAAQGIVPAPTRPAAAIRGARFRAFEVVVPEGGRVQVPIVAEELPEVGLGGFRLRASWDPGALALVDAALEDGGGEVVRDDAAGMVELALAQAPIGPSASTVVATLTFDALASRADPGSYLPVVEVADLRATVREARAEVRLGDVPRAAAALSREYARYVGGADRPGSLHAVLAGRGVAPEPLEAALLRALDVASRPGETDEIVEALDGVVAALDGAVAASFAALGGGVSDGVPVALEALAATDTTGAPLALAPTVAGRVLVGSDLPPTLPPPTESATDAAAAVSEAATAPPPPTVAIAPAPVGGSPPPLPRALVAALVIATAIGLVATWAALRREAVESEQGGER